MRQHLPGLNALRSIAALVVVTVHLEMEKSERGIPSAMDAEVRWVPDHHLGVVLFFVLSGFLITWLLVREQASRGRIDLRAFYIRRVLRIWPLYYFILLASAVLLPFAAGWDTILLCLAGAPNVAKAFGIGWPNSPHVWSIGVEEQFYFIWPWALILVPRRWILATLGVFVIGWSILPFWVDWLHIDMPPPQRPRYTWLQFFYGAKFNCMAMGCILGYLFATGNNVLRWLANDVVAYAAAAVAFGLWFTGTRFDFLHDELFSVPFALVVLNAASGRYPTMLDRGPLDFLGRISYGIYMYHWLVLLLMLAILDPEQGLVRYNILLHGSVVGLTVLIAWLSYVGPERYFRGLKRGFERH